MYFENIIGQEFAKKYLSNSIKNNKINHAYIFEGIDGIGKRKFAGELSSILFDGISMNSNPDCININPDGNSIKIAQIRKLQSDIIVKPHRNYKMYIINQSERMTIEAQNTLLKTLEEPPAYAIIILITNNKERLLDTVKSRCETIKFTPISQQDLKSYLINIKGIEEKRSALISNFARGSIEKALELVESAEFSISRDDIQRYIEIIVDKNVSEILNIASDMEKYKDDIINFLDMMLNYFRDIMFLKEGFSQNMIINIDKVVFIQNMSKKITYSQLSKIIDIIEETKKRIKSNCNFNTNIHVMALNIYEVIK